MAWNVAGCIESRTQGVVIVARVFNTAMSVLIANVICWTVVVIGTTTKMVMATIATDREELRAVAVIDAT